MEKCFQPIFCLIKCFQPCAFHERNTICYDGQFVRKQAQKVIERVRCFVWQTIHGKLPTKYYCQKWGIGSTDNHHRQGVPETIIQVFRDCSLAKHMWRQLVLEGLRSQFFGAGFNESAYYNVSMKDVEWNATWPMACHQLRRWRNKHEHDSTFLRPFYHSRLV